MPRRRSQHRCQACGATAAQWSGRCASCGEWNSLVEEALDGKRATTAAAERAVPISQVSIDELSALPTGVAELDRVLGGGVAADSVTLVGGEPGIGKSTLLLQAAQGMARVGSRVLYVSAEESRYQVRSRAERLGAVDDELWLASSTSLPELLAHLDEVQPDLVVVDSIQTLHDPELGPVPGSPTQVRECAGVLVREAKQRRLAIILVGHVTKDGALAGPRLLEHLVDTVLSFEGDRHHSLRLLRAVKHRFGSTNELGLFEMGEQGLAGVGDPSQLFLADRRPGTPGSVVVPVMEGHRPLLVELQGLVASTPHQTNPRRTAQGLDSGRLALLLAVLATHAGVNLSQHEVYASVVGGVRVVEPAADLAVALAVAGSLNGASLARDLVVCGEVGLGGEVRSVGQMPRRLAEAVRLGFRQAIVPRSSPDPPPGLELHRVRHLSEALSLTEGAGFRGR